MACFYSAPLAQIPTAVDTPNGQVFIDAGTVRLASAGTRFIFGANGAPVHINAGATLDFNGLNNARVDHLRDGSDGGGVITNGGGTNRSVQLNNSTLDTAFSGVIQDGPTNTFGIVKTGAATLTLTGASTYSGGTTIAEGTLSIGDGGTSGSIAGDITNNASLVFNRSDDTIFSGVIDGSGSLTKLGGGTQTLSGVNAYTGATAVDAGVLHVAAGGSIAGSTTTVNAGGLVVNGVAGGVNVAGGFLGGAGTVGVTTVGSGGFLSPGNSIGTITVNGGLTFASGSTYVVEVSPASADRTNVKAVGGTGAANLAGATVVAVYAPGKYVAKQYVIVDAEGGLVGRFRGLKGNAPTGFGHRLSYDAKRAYLDLTLAMVSGVGPYAGLTQNQQGVADALAKYFDRTGGIPAAFATLSKIGLTANSGETHTAAQTAGMGFGATFIGTIGGPDLGGPDLGGSGSGGGTGGADAYAAAYADQRPSPAAERFARMSYGSEELSGGADAGTRAMRLQHRLETGYGDGARRPERFSVWGAALGGGVSLAGNPVIGSQALSGSVVGMASGFDYVFSGERGGTTRAGVALGASWSSAALAGGFGAANVGNASIGLRASHDFGRLYLAGAAAYGVHFATTTRSFGRETYTAAFTGQSVSARAEAGWRFRTRAVDLIPFLAARAVSFSTPAYSETGSGAGTFALAFRPNASLEARSELGLRLNKAIDGASGGRTDLSAMAGWAHYLARGSSAAAGFANLPGTAFTTQGAAPAANTALVSLGVSHRFASGLGLSLDADGEFGTGTIGYAAKGKVSWRW